MASLASLVYGSNPTRQQAQRLISRGAVAAPRAQGRSARVLTATAAVECNDCGTNTTNGMVVDGQWCCYRCAHKASE